MSRSKWTRDDYGTTRSRGRKKKSPPFAQLPRYMVNSPAWHSLSGEAIAAYVAVAAVYNGANNGRLSLPVKSHARARGISPDTASRAIRELIAKGFADITKASAFNIKNRLATEYRLTLFTCDVTGELPTKEFMRWQPDGNKPRRPPKQLKRDPSGRFAKGIFNGPISRSIRSDQSYRTVETAPSRSPLIGP